jgi:hypothetical protein
MRVPMIDGEGMANNLMFVPDVDQRNMNSSSHHGFTSIHQRSRQRHALGRLESTVYQSTNFPSAMSIAIRPFHRALSDLIVLPHPIQLRWLEGTYAVARMADSSRKAAGSRISR